MDKLVIMGLEPTQENTIKALEREIENSNKLILKAMRGEHDLYAGIVEGDIVISSKWIPRAFVRAFYCEGKEMYCGESGYQIFKYDILTTKHEFVKYVYPVKNRSVGDAKEAI